MNPSFLPVEKIKELLNSQLGTSKKLMEIENLLFLHNINNKEAALEDFLRELEITDADESSQIDKEVKLLSNWDLATYYATALSMKAEDFYIRSYITINSSFPKAPFYTQELVARIAKASTVNPELFAKIYEIKQNSQKTNADFITIVAGNAGTGKTTAVFGLDIDLFRQTNGMTNI